MNPVAEQSHLGQREEWTESDHLREGRYHKVYASQEAFLEFENRPPHHHLSTP